MPTKNTMKVKFSEATITLPNGYFASDYPSIIKINGEPKALQETNDPDQIKKEARLIKNDFLKFGGYLQSLIPGAKIVTGDKEDKLKHLFKTDQSFEKKITGISSDNRSPSNVCDLIRMKIVVPNTAGTAETLEICRQELHPNNEEAIIQRQFSGKIVLKKDRYLYPRNKTGYSALFANIWLPIKGYIEDLGNGDMWQRGHIGEVQIVFEAMEKYYKDTHNLMEQIRSNKEEIKELVKEHGGASGAIRIPGVMNRISALDTRTHEYYETCKIINYMARKESGLNNSLHPSIKRQHEEEMEKLLKKHSLDPNNQIDQDEDWIRKICPLSKMTIKHA